MSLSESQETQYKSRSKGRDSSKSCEPGKTQPSPNKPRTETEELGGRGQRPRGHMLEGVMYVRSSNVDLLAGQVDDPVLQ